ncbi:tail assembly chaperone [Providencia phage Kokobel1]|uniref:Tail assembly protein n=1 Tax=Providencia phage Kokobel1 TaxID=2783540 RepID=A0A873WNE1_9CAUD|nr:tail assembly chaperone [Providencia phage Kokobel1]QPB11445.1 hypothetical protein [Providencia phage Kokobel1]
MSEKRIYVKHVRQAGYCANGLGRVLSRIGVDEREFLMNGLEITPQLIENTNPMIRKVVEIALADTSTGGERG